ncbi:MAG: hypothetical protein LBQ75_04095 [Zoogloeaceae bacterium]|nr:hypothetical protein [Zoogloeaceae bacterium]
MKRALTDFFLPCRVFLVVALLAMTLSGCVELDCALGAIAGAQSCSSRSAKEVEKARKIRDKEERVSKALTLKARNYLKTACEKEERFFIKPGIALDEGILILNNRGNAPLPLLKQAPKIARYREIQYGYSIPWDKDILDTTWMALSPFVAGEQKIFAQSSGADATEKTFRRASKAFWERAGLREQVLQNSLQMKALRDKERSEEDILKDYETAPGWKPFDLPVDTLNARYTFSVEDISTLEDRAHWAGRGRLRLTERDTGEIVAEYIGFAAYVAVNTAPRMQEELPSWYWEVTEMCPNTESVFYLSRNAWTPAYGFLRAIERTRGKAVSGFAAPVPTALEKMPSRFTSEDRWSTRVENTEHVRIENYTDYLYFPDSRIGTLEIVGSKIEMPNVNSGLNLGKATLDRLEITDSIIDGIFFEDARIGQWKISNSEILSTFQHYTEGSYIDDLVIINSSIETREMSRINAKHVRIENHADRFIRFDDSQIGTLEIVGSKIRLAFSRSKIDRLVITDSDIGYINSDAVKSVQFKIVNSEVGEFSARSYYPDHGYIENFEITNSEMDSIVFEDGEYRGGSRVPFKVSNFKISNSKIKEASLKNAHIKALEMTRSKIEKIEPHDASIGSIKTGGDEALRRKIMDAKGCYDFC